MVLGLLRKILSNYDEVEIRASVPINDERIGYEQYELLRLQHKYEVATEAIEALEKLYNTTTNTRIAEQTLKLLQDLRRARAAIEKEVAKRMMELEALKKAKQFLSDGDKNSGKSG